MTTEVAEKPLSNAAVGSVASAVLGLFAFGIFAGLAALGLGFYAKKQIDQGRARGLSLALTGIWAGSAVAGLTLLFALTTPDPPAVAPPIPAPVISWPGLGERILDRFFPRH